MTSVALLSEASSDLRRAVEFYAAERPGLAAAFLHEFEACAELLAQNPKLGVQVHGGARKLMLRRFPYVLVYRVEVERVLVLAVGHQRRHPDFWLGRL